MSDPASLLARAVASNYGGEVEFVDEDMGKSKLGAQYGLKGYPVLFVDDILFLQPADVNDTFGKPTGKYSPWNEKPTRERFKADLAKVIDLILTGRRSEAATMGSVPELDTAPQVFPSAEMVDLAGQKVDRESLRGKVVLVELWATWCPPCRKTLEWLEGYKKTAGVEVVGVALNSELPAVQSYVKEKGLTHRIVLGSPALASAFGRITSVPTLYVFDREGKLAASFYGAPPDLHQQVEAVVKKL